MTLKYRADLQPLSLSQPHDSFKIRTFSAKGQVRESLSRPDWTRGRKQEANWGQRDLSSNPPLNVLWPFIEFLDILCFVSSVGHWPSLNLWGGLKRGNLLRILSLNAMPDTSHVSHKK